MSGRPPKESLDFSAWDVSILDNDEKIDALIDAQGIGAFTIYFYLCQKAYGSKGYYLEWSYSRCATVSRKLGKGASADYVKNVVDMCFQSGLFDKRLFELYGILTSRGIQKRYLTVAKTRTGQHIISDFWLLEEDESAGYISCTENLNFQYSKSNYDTSKSNYQPLKESKVKNSKVNESIGESRSTTAADKVIHKYEQMIGLITPSVIEGIDFAIGEGMAPELIIRIIEYACEQGKRNWQYINACILGNLKENILTLDAYNRHQAERAERSAKKEPERIVKRSKFNNYEDSNKKDYSKMQEEILKGLMEG